MGLNNMSLKVEVIAHITCVPALCSGANCSVRKDIGWSELCLKSSIAGVVAPQRHLDLLQDKGVLGNLRPPAPPSHITLHAVIA